MHCSRQSSPQHPRTTLFPYTTLFRSRTADGVPQRPIGSVPVKEQFPGTLILMDVHPNANTGQGLGNCSLTGTDRKSTRLNSSHVAISYAVFCLKKKIKT